ncbi:DUF5666 domain-containing protein [Nocardia sp. bgisy134]|uniref:DUF5666 domain-containing protein n=1 Tax=unclassified Nocardia TaxID=2637762 RepID=UPI003D766039
MTNPKDPWGQRPEDAPTEHLGPPGASGYDPSGDTTRYPSTEQFEWGPPPANATKQLPPMESQWGAYESGYGQQYPGQQYPGPPDPHHAAMPPGAAPPGGPPTDQQPPKRNTGLWIALVLGVVALVAVAGVVAGLVLGGRDSSTTTAGGNTTANFPTGGAFPTQNPSPRQPSPSGLPGLPGLDGIGATMGTISANDGGQLTIDTVSGNTVAVRTDELTQVISLSGAKPADLPVGDMVMVQGDKGPDGSIRAKIIISTALPGGGR